MIRRNRRNRDAALTHGADRERVPAGVKTLFGRIWFDAISEARSAHPGKRTSCQEKIVTAGSQPGKKFF